MPRISVANHSQNTIKWEVQCKGKLPPIEQLKLYSDCGKAWAKKCSLVIPLPRGDSLIGQLGLVRLHKEKRCPCFRVDYGGAAHRWCAGGIYIEGGQLCRRGKSSEGELLVGKVDTRITDFFSLVKKRREGKTRTESRSLEEKA